MSLAWSGNSEERVAGAEGGGEEAGRGSDPAESKVSFILRVLRSHQTVLIKGVM